MIHYKSGNILDVTSGIIMHGCNAQGVMGSGVALAIREKYPEAYDTYKNTYDTYGLKLGDVIWLRTTDELFGDDLFIANAITQEFYGKGKRHVNYKAIVDCFTETISNAKHLDNRELHFPKIGAGLGGGDWNIIEQLINDCDPEDTVTKICWVW